MKVEVGASLIECSSENLKLGVKRVTVLKKRKFKSFKYSFLNAAY